jgi:IclR family transcriptional regulator, KDG regulon repressor
VEHGLARGNRRPLSSPAGGKDNNKPDETALKGSAPPAVDKTLTKGLQLLEALSEGEEARGISELALQLSLTKSNVHRLLQTLTKCGYVTREASTERYLLSTKLWRISRRGRPFEVLRRPVRPVLRSLVEETNESVLFCVIESDELVPIDQVETPSPVRVFFSVGQPFPIDQVLMNGKGLTALQLIALAGRSQMEARATAQKVQQQLHKDDAYGEMVLSQISEARNNKFAFSRGEWVSGVNAVAVPVQDLSHNLIGVLSCFGPTDRLPDSNFKTVQEILSRGAQEIARRLSV